MVSLEWSIWNYSADIWLKDYLRVWKEKSFMSNKWFLVYTAANRSTTAILFLSFRHNTNLSVSPSFKRFENADSNSSLLRNISEVLNQADVLSNMTFFPHLTNVLLQQNIIFTKDALTFKVDFFIIANILKSLSSFCLVTPSFHGPWCGQAESKGPVKWE